MIWHLGTVGNLSPFLSVLFIDRNLGFWPTPADPKPEPRNIHSGSLITNSNQVSSFMGGGR